ncbi:DUF4136 domain-containing protein [Altererythrobacter sp. TH136]|uniref:DUF4136 domain-containing protein n=1 Tax=Altererythrobacter sp. TH136 TaxID=2067415 RepID=UPI00116371FF|nr:DUF4136 domain-containing protein [Altererythrobacter sp. TH136]QDM41470.1 DUF4136 domain-containing protein [Altererythrobacter sp. TH136]
MSILTNWGRKLKMIAVPLALGALAACATPFNANVQRFQSALPAPQGQTFTVVADDPALAGGLEFSQYAHQVADRMAALGYTPVNDVQSADLLVRFDYGVDRGRERVRRTGFVDPFYSPWYGYSRFGYRGFYRPGYYGRGYFARPWSYGFHDPFFDNGLDVYTVYTSGIDLKIDRRATGERLFEGKAEAVSTSNRLPYLVPNLVQALFTDFPGRSGETVRISVAPENQAAQRRR